ncbi:flagellin [Mongoliimonas terrestris]|uniref:flagellin N-terminal helical domain-containing protein n=1 Tax=Mongoliimonas terrestris TaxID=1709001 RepID=UPI0009495BC7|nr:flagellin [Mongoliimonas terrestris]
MGSLLTNASAQTALQNLAAISRSMDTVQNRISTGLKVDTAADNAAYWSIATTMRSDNMALGAIKDALGLGGATVDVQYTALNATVDIVKEIKAKLVAAAQPGIDRSKIQADITQLQGQLSTIATSAMFNGQNWLSVDSSAAGYSANKQVLSSFIRTSTGAVSVQTITVDITDVSLYDASVTPGADGILDKDVTVGGTTVSMATINITALTDSAADMTTLAETTSIVELQLGAITAAATQLGSAKKRIQLQQTFVKALMDAFDRGIGQLVDADLDAESTRLKAIQVQQQLGVQALQIANGNSQNILALFRN